MTTDVRLLSTYKGFAPQSIISLPDAEATSLVSVGHASLTLTGGTRRYQDLAPLSNAAVYTPVGVQTIGQNQRFSITIPEGFVLTTKVATGGVGTLQAVDASGAAIGSPVALSGTTTQSNATGTRRYVITCTAGSIDASVGDAVVGAAQLSPVAAGIQNAYGGVIGFRSSQVTLVSFGDSRDQAMYTGAQNNYKSSQHWFNWLNDMLGQPMRCVGNFGISGKRTDETLTDAILAQAGAIQSDFALFDFMAVNDLAQSSATPFINNDGISVTHSNVGQVAADKVIAAMKVMLRAGKTVVVQAEPGATTLSAQHIRQLFDYNERIANFCRNTPGTRFLDHTDAVWASSAAGTIAFKSGYSTDGTHHASLYAYAVAKKYKPIFQSWGIYAPSLFPKSLSNINANNPRALFENPLFAVASGGTAPTGGTITVSGVGGGTAVLNTPRNCKWAGPAGSTAVLVSVTADGYGGNILVYDVAHNAAGLVELTFEAPSAGATFFDDVFQAGVDVAVTAGSVNACVEWQTQINSSIGTFNGFDLYSAVGGPGPTEAYSLTLGNQPAGFLAGTTAGNKGYEQPRIGFRFFTGGGSIRVALSNPFNQRLYSQ